MFMQMPSGHRLGNGVCRHHNRARKTEQNPRNETQSGVNTGLLKIPFNKIAPAGDEDFTRNLDTSLYRVAILNLTAHLRYSRSASTTTTGTKITPHRELATMLLLLLGTARAYAESLFSFPLGGLSAGEMLGEVAIGCCLRKGIRAHND
jgi:hypothetical protein